MIRGSNDRKHKVNVRYAAQAAGLRVLLETYGVNHTMHGVWFLNKFLGYHFEFWCNDNMFEVLDKSI